MVGLAQYWAGFLAQPVHLQILHTSLIAVAILCRHKVFMWTRGILFFIAWGEKKGMSKHRDSKNVVPPKGATETESKVIIFIRHGESDWNYVFNKNKLLLLPRLLIGMLWEAFMYPFNNSFFIDAALSSEGIEQAQQLQKFIAEYSKKSDTPDDVHEALRALRGDPGALPSVLVSSNLRRAVATGCIALWPRQKRTGERTLVLSSLQEMSRNVDTTALAGPRELPEISVEKQVLGPTFRAKNCIDVSQSAGNKGFKRKGVKSMEEFNAWCFKRPEPVIIVNAGHSLWFKNYFKVYMPKSTEHHAKNLKMVNCGVVAFNLEKGVMDYDVHQTGYRVDADSLASLYGGFEKRKMEAPRKKQLKFPIQKGTNGNGNSSKDNGNQSGSASTCVVC